MITNTVTKVSYGEYAVELAKIALKARLYVPGWDLNPTLHTIIKHANSMCYGVAVTFYYDKPIAVAITKATWNGVVYTFVKPKHRKNGHGRNVTKSLLSKYVGDEEPAGHGTGIKGASKFFESMGLPIKENYDDGYD